MFIQLKELPLLISLAFANGGLQLQGSCKGWRVMSRLFGREVTQRALFSEGEKMMYSWRENEARISKNQQSKELLTPKIRSPS